MTDQATFEANKAAYQRVVDEVATGSFDAVDELRPG